MNSKKEVWMANKHEKVFWLTSIQRSTNWNPNEVLFCTGQIGTLAKVWQHQMLVGMLGSLTMCILLGMRLYTTTLESTLALGSKTDCATHPMTLLFTYILCPRETFACVCQESGKWMLTETLLLLAKKPERAQCP